MQTERRISVVMTCHNRRERTVSCLEGLFAQELPSDAGGMEIFLVDDGSEDGTEREVRRLFPQVRMLRGDGRLYWCGGMRRAFSRAMEEDPDFYLWLNDDTALMPGAVRSLVRTYDRFSGEGSPLHIVVGSTCDPVTGRWTYGGVVRCSRWHPFRYAPVLPSSAPVPCHTFNGNCVLIHREVARRVGNLDPSFTHAIGDTDYGLRAEKSGCSMWVAPGFLGNCTRNPAGMRWDSSRIPARKRIASLSSPKGFPVREMKVFAKRHGGWGWPLFWVMPVVRGVLFPSNHTDR